MRVFDKYIKLVGKKYLLSALSIIDKELKFHEKDPQTDEGIPLSRTVPFLNPAMGGFLSLLTNPSVTFLMAQ